MTADNRVLSEEQALISEMLDAIERYLTKGCEVSFEEKSRLVYRLVDVVSEREKVLGINNKAAAASPIIDRHDANIPVIFKTVLVVDDNTAQYLLYEALFEDELPQGHGRVCRRRARSFEDAKGQKV